MSVLESKVEADLRDAVKEVGGLCIKLPAILYRGIPDRMVLLPGGRIFFIELKRKVKAGTKSSTKVHQDRFQKILLTLGFLCLKIEGPTQLEEFISSHVKNHLPAPVQASRRLRRPARKP